ncbi:MAG: L-aspartate oxidase [Pirellulaceae bacterium]|nr:L-aspartate oxidase [Planctomycetales bacterium]
MTEPTPRYLVPIDPKRVPHYFADLLIIGGGIAGIRAAIAADPGLNTLVVTKDIWRESNSNYAQGGIAGVMDPDDSFSGHVEDTIVAGGELCHRDVVETVVRAAPECIRELIEWGTQFDASEGQLHLGREGGHGHNRILHALGDATGQEIMRSIIEHVRMAPHIEMWERTFTIDLLVDDGVCRGALVWNQHHGRTLVWAKQTILCTGGAGQLYRESTNPPVATGDGVAMGYRAGAEVRDMEFMQFHPTVLYIAGSSRSLITEAMRGEGAHLVDKDGHRFMLDYDERAELAPRDIVAQAIVSQMEKTRHPSVYLDLSHLDAEYVLKRFPGIAKRCAEFGIDIARDPIPVRPGAHYMMGGLTVDMQARTTLPGLWAAGEVTSSGLHGANRLASNSLLEGLVYGKYAGEGASRAAAAMNDSFRAIPLRWPPLVAPAAPLDLVDIRNTLKSVMWRAVGVRRDEASLKTALESIQRWCHYVLRRQFTEPAGWELQNMLTVARLMVQAAVTRQESRGVHLRSDFPDKDNEHWNRHQAFSLGNPSP